MTASAPIFGFFGHVSKSLHAFKVYSPNQEEDANILDKDLFDDDITQSGKDINQYSSPMLLIDTQNKIWLKII